MLAAFIRIPPVATACHHRGPGHLQSPGQGQSQPRERLQEHLEPSAPTAAEPGPHREHAGGFTETQEMSGKEKGSDVCKAAVHHWSWQVKAKINTLLLAPQHRVSPGWESLIAWPTRACCCHSDLGFQGLFLLK